MVYETRQDVRLSEQHPREQGLKHPGNPLTLATVEAFRATSKRTRIETFPVYNQEDVFWHFQSNIQENKD